MGRSSIGIEVKEFITRGDLITEKMRRVLGLKNDPGVKNEISLVAGIDFTEDVQKVEPLIEGIGLSLD